MKTSKTVFPLRVPTKDGDFLAVYSQAGLCELSFPREEASREFNSTHFQSTFFNLNVLKVVTDLIELLGLDHLEEEVVHTLIHEMFTSRASGSPRKGEGETFVGYDADLLFHRLRQIAERKQRSYRR